MKNDKIPKSEILQRQKPYQSTIDFQNFLLENKVLSHIKKKKVLDVGTGISSNLKYFADQYEDGADFWVEKEGLQSAPQGLSVAELQLAFETSDPLQPRGELSVQAAGLRVLSQRRQLVSLATESPEDFAPF